MSFFYGILKGARGHVTRTGTKDSGIYTIAASYSGAIEVEMWYNGQTGETHYEIVKMYWPSKDNRRVVKQGILNPQPKLNSEVEK